MTNEMLTRALNGTLAHNAEGIDAAPNGEWAVEAKYDGWRLLAEVREDKVCFYSRSGNDYSGKLPAVEADLLAMLPPGSWVDGEAVAIKLLPDGKVVNEWGTAQSVLTKGGANMASNLITFVVFDLLAHRGIDARPLAFSKRRDLLTRIFEKHTPTHCQLSMTLPTTVKNHDALVRMGFEGSMWKRLDAPYASGKRGHGQAKWKHAATEDVVIMGFESGKDVGAVVFGQFKDGKLVQRGTCKRKPDLIPTPDLMAWAGKVIELKHNGVMPSGALRHPSMERIRDDKGAEQCLWT
jgi:bifunctional non-homologous end joining protein LigD